MNNEMLELTEKNGLFKVIIPLRNIMSIVQNKDGNAFIETGCDKNGESLGFETAELFSDIRKMVARLILFGDKK